MHQNLTGEKVDLWALACCLIEVFGGPIPYEEIAKMSRVIHRIIEEKQPPFVPYWFHPQAKECFQKCLSFLPEDRPCAAYVLEVMHNLSEQDIIDFGMDRKGALIPE